MNCYHCNRPVEQNWTACPNCNAPIQQHASQIQKPPVYNPDTQPPYQTPIHGEGDATGGIIPYKNPKALLAYYLGIVSGFPLIGLPFGIAAFVLGIMGLRDKKRNPAIKGSIHAGIGIGCGGLFTLLWTLAFALIVLALISDQR